MGKERARRRHARKAVRGAYVEYSKAGTRLSRLFRPEVKRGPMVDLSQDGVCFRATGPLEVGDALYMTLRFANLKESVRLKAVVRWVRPERKVGIEDYTHVIGAQFIEYTPQGWDLIAAAMGE